MVSDPSSISEAQRLFHDGLEEAGSPANFDIERLCRKHPGKEAELRRLYMNWGRLQRWMPKDRSELVSLDDQVGQLDWESVRKRFRDRRTAGRYEFLEPVARGGQGDVIRARDADLHREVAIKVIREDQLALGKQSIGRLIEEAQITAQLDHPGIVPIHDIATDEQGRICFAMKLVRGRSLESMLRNLDRSNPLATSGLVKVIVRAAEAILFAHDRGVVHRDLKPANIMVGDHGEVYVMDWGLASVGGGQANVVSDEAAAAAAAAAAASCRVETDRVGATDDGAPRRWTASPIGTPAYMSPEQARQDPPRVEPSTDVYAMGAILYHVLAGYPPYGEKRHSPGDLLSRVRTDPPLDIDRIVHDQPAELIAICKRAMARDPRDRYENMSSMMADLQAFFDGRVVRAYRTGAWVELRKWVKRNRLVASAVGAAFLFAVLGVIGVALSEKRSAAKVMAERDKEAAVKSFLLGFFDGANPAERHDGAEPLVSTLLRETLFKLDEAADGMAPATLEAVRRAAGRACLLVGLEAEALEQLEKALASMSPEEALGTVALMVEADVAQVLTLQRRHHEAEERFERILPRLSMQLGDRHEATIAALGHAAMNDTSLANYSRARTRIKQAVEACERTGNTTTQLGLFIKKHAGIILRRAGDLDGARKTQLEILRILGEQGRSEHYWAYLAHYNLALAAADAGALADAEEHSRIATDGLARTVSPTHPSVLRARMLTARIESSRGRSDDAIRELTDVRNAWLNRGGGDAEPDVWGCSALIGSVLVELGRLDEAERELVAVVDLCKDDDVLKSAYSDLARLCGKQRRIEEAESYLWKAVEANRRIKPEGHLVTVLLLSVLAENILGPDPDRTDEYVALLREIVRVMPADWARADEFKQRLAAAQATLRTRNNDE